MSECSELAERFTHRLVQKCYRQLNVPLPMIAFIVLAGVFHSCRQLNVPLPMIAFTVLAGVFHSCRQLNVPLPMIGSRPLDI